MVKIIKLPPPPQFMCIISGRSIIIYSVCMIQIKHLASRLSYVVKVGVGVGDGSQ